MQHQLSSPSTSYEFEYTPTNIYLRHPQTYAERLKSSKARIEALEAAEAARQETSLDWETRTRIARGLHFSYLGFIPKALYSRLKVAGHGFLPPLLSAWAMHRLETYCEPLPVVAEVDEEAMDSYASIILSLERGGFTDDMNTLWNLLPADGIRLMVNVWLTRSADRAGIAHPVPTSAQALAIIESDHRLSSAEKYLAATLVPFAVNKIGIPLFDTTN